MLRAGTVRKKGLCPPFLKGRYSFVKGQTSTSALKRFMNKDNTVGHLQNIQVLGVQRSKLSREGEYGYA